MDTTELLKRVRRVEIKTRGLSSQVFSGEYHSAFKGRGMSFSEVRNYQPGDDVRDIDWNVTARTGTPHVKIFEEERELSVIVLCDVSGSMTFGTHDQQKRQLATELAAVVGFSALNNNDKVGAVLYGSGAPLYIPPKKGVQHTLRIVRELIDAAVSPGHADLGGALRFVNNVTKRRAVVFVLTDMLDQGGYATPLRVAGRRHDVVVMRLIDPFERELPRIGLLPIRDSETGATALVDTSDGNTRARFANFYSEERARSQSALRKTGASVLDLTVGEDYAGKLLTFFKGRHKRMSA